MFHMMRYMIWIRKPKLPKWWKSKLKLLNLTLRTRIDADFVCSVTQIELTEWTVSYFSYLSTKKCDQNFTLVGNILRYNIFLARSLILWNWKCIPLLHIQIKLCAINQEAMTCICWENCNRNVWWTDEGKPVTSLSLKMGNYKVW